MATNDYITIDEGASGLVKRFKAIAMQPVVHINKQMDANIEGDWDLAYGAANTCYRFTLVLPYTVSSTHYGTQYTNYGTYDNFKTIFSRNNPNGTPSTRFTFTDHWSTTHTNSFFGGSDATIEPACTIIDNYETRFFVDVEIYVP